MQNVKVALAEGQQTILDSGPEPGAKIVSDGADRLKPGQPVTIAGGTPRAGQGSRQSLASPGSSPGQPASSENPKSGGQHQPRQQ